jgi:phosphohistidine phosphatase
MRWLEAISREMPYSRPGEDTLKLYVMRHGPAEDTAPSGRDFDRALTPSGRSRVETVAEELSKKGEAPRLILTSPLVRAVQTADIVHVICKPQGPVEVRREISPSGDLDGLVREMVAAGARRVMLVGHEPDVSSLVSRLVPSWTRGMDKAMVIGLRVRDGEAPELRFVLEPKSLAWST